MLESAVTALARKLGSATLALPIVAAVAGGAFATALELPGARLLLVGAGGALAVNLSFALSTIPKLRVNGPLFALHFCLLVLIVLFLLGQATRLRAHFELAEGEWFTRDRLVLDEQGPLNHWYDLPEPFRQARIEVDYGPRIERGRTTSLVWMESGGAEYPVRVSDGEPLVIAGHRFYPTHNKGFSAILSWIPATGEAPMTGSINFPSFPRTSWKQTTRWVTPGGATVELELAPDPFPGDGHWKLSSRLAGEVLVVRVRGSSDRTLAVGGSVDLPGGRIRLERLGMWMGYRVFFDPTLPWLLVAAAASVLSLALVLGRRLSALGRLASVRPLPEGGPS